ncbi:MAG: hypothetical protein AB1810_04010 [Pseudomonadota bacterium]
MLSTKGWLLALSAGTLYCVNQWLTVHGLKWPTTLLVLVLFGVVAITAVQPALRRYLPAIFFLSVIGFPAYSADPYAIDYVAPFSLAKFVALGSLALMCRPALSVYGISLFFIIVIATGMAVLLGRFGDIWAEVWYVILIVFALNTMGRKGLASSAHLLLSALERIFYLLVPIAAFTYATGMHDERSGGTVVYFYGHWIGIATTFAVYAALSQQSTVFRVSWIRLTLLITTIYVCMASYQSAHFILFIVAVLIAMYQQRKRGGRTSNIFLPLIALTALLLAGTVILQRGETDSWLYLKISQVFLLASGGFVEASNSVTIRVSQLISMFEQGNIWTILFGRGMSSIYFPEGALWDSVIFHEATFPERELASGQLQYIHEPVVMLLKWSGLVGLTLVILGLFGLRRITYIDRQQATLVIVVFLLFFASSLHTGILVTGLFILSKGVKLYVSTKSSH